MEAFLNFVHSITGFSPFLFAFIAGIGFALPIGPMSIIAVKHVKHHGLASGFKIAAFCLLGDFILGVTAFRSYDWVLSNFSLYERPLSIGIGFFLLALGYFMRHNHQEAPQKEGIKLYMFALFMTCSNPGNILGFLTYSFLSSPLDHNIAIWPNLFVILLGAFTTWVIVLNWSTVVMRTFYNIGSCVSRSLGLKQRKIPNIPLGSVVVTIIGLYLLFHGFVLST